MKFKSIGLILGYFIFRFGLEQSLWSKVNIYWSYFAEFCYVILGHKILNVKNHFRHGQEKKLAYLFLLACALGSFFYFFSNKMKLITPFDFKSWEGFFLMVFLAPVLEELIYRKIIWDASLFITKNNLIILFFNAAAFSFAHFMSYWFIPDEFKSFVLFQAWYTFVLGFVCGLARNIFSDFKPAVLVHFGFNLVFYLLGRS